MVTFNSIDDVWNEVFIRASDVENDEKFTLGQNLWAELFHYCSPNMLVDNETMNLVQEVVYCMSWDMPPFKNLDEADANKLKLMTTIKEEIQTAQTYKAKKDGKKSTS